MPSTIHHLFSGVAHIIDIVGILILLYGFILAFKDLITFETERFRGKKRTMTAHMVRCKLGTYILIGLEFMIVSDIINSFVSHEMNELVYLGVTVIIRTTISFFLGKEIEKLPEESR